MAENIRKRKKTASSGSKNKKNSSGKKAVKKPKTSDGIPMCNEICLVASFGILLIMMLSNFGLCGAVGRGLSSFFFGIFGWSQYVMPLAFFLGAAVLIANDYSPLAMKKCGAGFIALMILSSFAQLLYTGEEVNVSELFALAVEHHETGGIIGGGIAVFLQKGFGMAGALIILICAFLLSLILVTQKSFVAFFKKIMVYFKKMPQQWRENRQHSQHSDEKPVVMGDMEEEPAVKKSSFLKMKSGKKKNAEKDRVKQCEEKVRELEEQIGKKKQEINIPVMTSPDERKRKDCVKELHPKIYPFTQDDGKSEPFQGKLDFSAFSFQDEQDEKETRNFCPSSLPEEIVLKIAQMEEMEDMEDTEDTQPSEKPEELSEIQEGPEPKSIPENMEKPEIKDSVNDTLQKTTAEKREGNKTPEKEKSGKKVPDRRKARKSEYLFPPYSLLTKEKQQRASGQDRYLKETAVKLQQTLHSFGVNVTITDISCGPTVTRYEMFPEQGTKVSKILSLSDDIKLNLAASDIRIEAPIPGKAAIGIEVPNKQNMTVHFRDMVESRTFKNFKSRLAFAVGKDIGGRTVVADLAKMPHLLIAGATGSGKSVCINTLVMSILYKASPEDVKLIMIDPKMVELSIYNGIPHLLIPVVIDPKKASGALNWAVAEMTQRYRKFTETGVRNIEGYNKKVADLVNSGEADGEKLKKMPQIVVIIDELADLMMVAPGEVEDAIVRLSQLARAAGIHLVIATQRPSVNVITGLIKANVPSRIAFSVSSGVDSRTIIDMNGAEKLLGKGDMLFYPAGYQKPIRVQGAFVSDKEINQVVDFLKENEDMAVYDEEVSEKIEQKIAASPSSQERDEYFEAAARFIMEKDKATIGMLQRMFKIGFNRAARIIDQLAQAGIVGPEEGTKPRKILMTPEQLDEYFEENL
ncbi:MAG: DNA translocase FtsK [Eubacterium sp.]|nr:DNA translocase FtsK [Eubacterium sp.]